MSSQIVDHSSCNPSAVTASEEILANNCRPHLHFEVSGSLDRNIVYCTLKPGWEEVEVRIVLKNISISCLDSN